MTIFRVAETASTNTDMLAMVAKGDAREGDWLIARQQTAGRGRMGRSWVSAPGNLYASTPIQLRDGDPLPQTLSLLCGWALWSVPGLTSATLKWPNDLILDDKKLAGILLERSGDHVVAGFGVNVANAPDLPDRLTTSISSWAGDEDADVQRIFAGLQESLKRNLCLWREQGFDIIRRYWEGEGPSRGQHLKVNLSNGMTIEGSYLGIADDGALKLQLASGRLELVRSGDVFTI